MRLRLRIKQIKKDQLIPINYQFSVSSFIYRTIETSDSGYSKWLHDTGYMSGAKKFKYFTFSKLMLPESEMIDLYGLKYLKLKSETIDIIVSMLSTKTVENFIIGMFENQKFRIYDSNVESEFIIKTVEMVPEPEFTREMVFRTISPIVISKKVIYNGKESQKYLGPEDDEYEKYFKSNLEEKYITLLLNESSYESKVIIEKERSSLDEVELMGQSKAKLITIKEGRQTETKVKGFYFTFRLKGETEIMRIGYEAGFGKNCSQGFGCVETIKRY